MFKNFSKRVQKSFYPKKPPTNWIAYSRVACMWVVVGFCGGLLLVAIGAVLTTDGSVKPILWFTVGVLGLMTLYWTWVALDDAKKDGLFELLGYRARCLWFERGVGVGVNIKRLQGAFNNSKKKGGDKGK